MILRTTLLVLFVPSLALADVLPDFEEPDCDPGYVVTYTHGGPQCVRPSCRTDADCPPGLGLVCPPGYCFRWVEDRECLEREGLGRRDRTFESRNAFEPPPPCPPLQERDGPETCLTASDCGEGLNCSPRSCRPGPNAMAASMTAMSAMTDMSNSEMSSSEMSSSGTEQGSDDEPTGCALGGTPSALGLWLLPLVFRRRR